MADKAEKKTVDTAKKAANKKEKKPSLFSKIFKFFRECKSELKKVVWFSKKQTFNSTVLVIVCLVICSAIICALDYGFSQAIFALGKLI